MINKTHVLIKQIHILADQNPEFFIKTNNIKLKEKLSGTNFVNTLKYQL
jgi:hypothetical protein